MNCNHAPEIRVFPSPQELAQAVTSDWIQSARQAEQSQRLFSVALSGGSTPRLLYQLLALPKNSRQIPWPSVHLFWGDERCVPPDHADSNYRMAWETLLKFTPLPQENIHRIAGELDPQQASQQYAQKIRKVLGEDKPRLDWVLLGMGTDGHTASLFPGQSLLKEPQGICGVAERPDHQRISLTLDVINNAKRVSFIVAGAAKADRVYDILEKTRGSEKLPAAEVCAENVEWLLDQEAAARLKR